MDGRPLQAIESIARAMRLNPHSPAWYYWLKGEAEYAVRDHVGAIKTLRHKATYGTPSRSILAAALAQLGHIEEARFEARLLWRRSKSIPCNPVTRLVSRRLS